MIFLFDGLDARLRHCHIKHKRNILMTDKRCYAGRMVEFSVLFKTDVDFPDVLRFHIMLQAPGECPANNLTSIIFKEGMKCAEIFPMAQGNCGIFPGEMT